MVNPAIGQAPTEFINIDLAALEGELEAVMFATDWIRNEPTALVDWGRADTPNTSQREVQNWREACALPVHGSLGAHVLIDLLSNGGPFGIGNAEQTFRRLAQNGCERDKTFAGQVVVDFKEMRDGGQER